MASPEKIIVDAGHFEESTQTIRVAVTLKNGGKIKPKSFGAIHKPCGYDGGKTR